MNVDVKNHVTLYQSRFFEDRFPEDNFAFENIRLTNKTSELGESLKLCVIQCLRKMILKLEYLLEEWKELLMNMKCLLNEAQKQ